MNTQPLHPRMVKEMERQGLLAKKGATAPPVAEVAASRKPNFRAMRQFIVDKTPKKEQVAEYFTDLIKHLASQEDEEED